MDKISRDVLESQLDKSHTLEKATILRYMDTMSFSIKLIAEGMLRHEYIQGMEGMRAFDWFVLKVIGVGPGLDVVLFPTFPTTLLQP